MIVESGHVLVLGWTPKLFTLLGELDEANANQARPLVVVVLAIDDKMTMDTALHDLARQYRSLRIVCRTGDSGDIGTLRTVAAERSKAIVVLSRPHDGDPHAVRTVLALGQLGLPRETTVVVELLEESRVRALRSAADIPFVPIVARDWIARIVAHVCRTPGLGAVYRDLLDFAGDEIYFESIPARLSGLRYFEVVARCLHGAAIGVVASGGDVELAPPPDRLLVDGDRLVVLAEDDGTVRFADLPVAVAPGSAPATKLRAPDHVGVLGWNGLGINVLRQFDEFLPPDSSIELVCDERSTSRAPLPTEPFQRFQLRHRFADTTDPDELARLVGSSTLDCLLILNGHEELGVHSADARVLLAMLETRHMLDADRTLQVVAEFADPSNTRLAGPERSEEFIVGEQLAALLMAQVVENPALVGVFSELVDADGVDIDVVGVEAFVSTHEMLTFRELAFRAATHRHAAIGTRAPDGTVTLNPPSDRQVPTDPGTQLVVLRHLSEGR